MNLEKTAMVFQSIKSEVTRKNAIDTCFSTCIELVLCMPILTLLWHVGSQKVFKTLLSKHKIYGRDHKTNYDVWNGWRKIKGKKSRMPCMRSLWTNWPKKPGHSLAYECQNASAYQSWRKNFMMTPALVTDSYLTGSMIEVHKLSNWECNDLLDDNHSLFLLSHSWGKQGI